MIKIHFNSSSLPSFSCIYTHTHTQLIPSHSVIPKTPFLVLVLCSCILVFKFTSFLMETTELKVEMVEIHEKRLRKCLSKLRGIEKVEVDGNSEKVVVIGYAHRNKILKAVRRAGLKADFWSAQNELLNAYASSSFQNLRFNNFNLF